MLLVNIINAGNYPLMRSGGLFVLLMGLGIASGGLLGRKSVIPSLIVGGVLAIISQIIFGRQLTASLGVPTRAQNYVLLGSIVLEMILVGIVGYVIRDTSLRGFWLWILLVVGFHLAILSYAQGPLMLLLGLLCMINAVVGLQWKSISYLRFWLLDGVLKMVFGAMMLLVRPG